MNIKDNQVKWMKEEYAKLLKAEIDAAPIEELTKLVVVEENEENWKLSIRPSSVFSKADAAKAYTEHITK